MKTSLKGLAEDYRALKIKERAVWWQQGEILYRVYLQTGHLDGIYQWAEKESLDESQTSLRRKLSRYAACKDLPKNLIEVLKNVPVAHLDKAIKDRSKLEEIITAIWTEFKIKPPTSGKEARQGAKEIIDGHCPEKGLQRNGDPSPKRKTKNPGNREGEQCDNRVSGSEGEHRPSIRVVSEPDIPSEPGWQRELIVALKHRAGTLFCQKTLCQDLADFLEGVTKHVRFLRESYVEEGVATWKPEHTARLDILIGELLDELKALSQENYNASLNGAA